MDYSKQLPLRIKRDLGDIIGDGFKFIIKNISSIVSAWLVYVLPALIIPMAILASTGIFSRFMDMTLEGSEDIFSFFTTMGLMSIGTVLAYFMGNLVIYSAFKAYDENGNEKLTIGEISDNVKHFFGNYLISSLILLGIFLGSYLAVVGLILLSPVFGVFVMIVFLFAIVWFMIIMQFFSYIRIQEELTVSEGWVRAFYLVKGEWWTVFGVMIVIGIVTMVMTYAIVIPISMVSAFSSFSSVDPLNGMDDSMGSYMMIVSTITSIITLFFQQYVTTCKVLMYFDLSNAKDRENLFDEIENLGENPDSIFENEGEY